MSASTVSRATRQLDTQLAAWRGRKLDAVAYPHLVIVTGQPVKTLVLVGSLNGFILPLSVGSMLLAARRPAIVGEYRHPTVLVAAGWLVALSMATMGGYTLVRDIPRLLSR